MSIWDSAFTWPPPSPIGGEGGESGGGGAGGTWESGECPDVSCPHALIIADLAELVGVPRQDPFLDIESCLSFWAYTYLVYDIDSLHIWKSENSSQLNMTRTGDLCAIWEQERLCEGTIIGGKKFSFNGNFNEAKSLGYYSATFTRYSRNGTHPGEWLTHAEMQEIYFAEAFDEECCAEIDYKLLADYFSYPIPWFHSALMGVGLPIQNLLVPLSQEILQQFSAAMLSCVGGQQAARRKRRKGEKK